MKKLILLIIVIALALGIDGTLTRDIFDYRIETVTGWLVLVLIIAVALIIVLANAAKKDDKENNSI